VEIIEPYIDESEDGFAMEEEITEAGVVIKTSTRQVRHYD
jgi:hypothetical protein